MGVGYRGQIGVALTFFHPVRDMNGALVAGQAANLGKTLLGPDRLAAPAELAAITLTDFGAAPGWVQGVFTGTRLGEYTLALTNPALPTADGLTTDYSLVMDAGISAGANLLTSLDRVRTRLQLQRPNNGGAIQPGDSHPFDSLINLLISEVSDEYQARLGRSLAEKTYTEYLGGTGRSSLVLGAGPLVSISSLSMVQYSDDGAGGVTETLTALPRWSYVLSGLRGKPGFFGLGRIDMIGCSSFTKGAKNYKAVYVAGFNPIPETIVGLATEDVVYRLLTRDTWHTLSQALADGNISIMRPAQLVEMRDQRLAPYLMDAA